MLIDFLAPKVLRNRLAYWGKNLENKRKNNKHCCIQKSYPRWGVHFDPDTHTERERSSLSSLSGSLLHFYVLLLPESLLFGTFWREAGGGGWTSFPALHIPERQRVRRRCFLEDSLLHDGLKQQRGSVDTCRGGEREIFLKKKRHTERSMSGCPVTIMEEDDGHLENGVHDTKDSDRQQRLRLCVLNEMVNTERDYVRTLLFLQSVSSTWPLVATRWPRTGPKPWQKHMFVPLTRRQKHWRRRLCSTFAAHFKSRCQTFIVFFFSTAEAAWRSKIMSGAQRDAQFLW